MSSRKQFVPPIVCVLVFSLLLSSCAAPRSYSLAELEKDEDQYQRLLGKKIEVHKKNDDIIIGHLTGVEKEALVISMKKNDPSPREVAKAEIRYIKVKHDTRNATIAVALVVTIGVIYWLAAKSFADAYPND